MVLSQKNTILKKLEIKVKYNMKNQQEIDKYLEKYYVEPNDVLEGIMDFYDLNLKCNNDDNIQITTQKFLDWLQDEAIYGEVNSTIDIKLKVMEYKGTGNKCDFCYYQQFDYCGNMLCNAEERPEDGKSVYFIKDEKIY